MGDIEDGFDVRTSAASSDFRIKVRSKKEQAKQRDEPPNLGSVLSWSKTVYLRTWGCSHNNSDSEYMAGLLSAAGFKVTSKKEAADCWLLNSCTVKTPSQAQVENVVNEAKTAGKRVVVAGCVSQAAPTEPWLKDVSIVGVRNIDQVVDVVDETMQGNVVRLLSQKREPNKLNLPKTRRNEFIEILAINSGCLNHCTYCKTKLARGDLRSYPVEALVEQARTAFENDGCKELWLTSEDLGAWGRDIGMVLPDLLNELVKEVAEILNHPRVYSFLHIPVQSGSDAVLSDMKREYTREHFERIVDYMNKNVPGIYIATDFICAFPTETAEDFEESMQLVRRYQFPSLFINQFFPRPGTPAARLKKVDTVEAKRRTAAMTELFRSYSRYTADRVGEEHDVLICEKATDGVHYVGHNKSYEHLLVPGDGRDLLGCHARVRVTEVSKFYMKSVLVSSEPRAGGLQVDVPPNSVLNFFYNAIKAPVFAENSYALRIIVLSQVVLLVYYGLKLLLS